MKNFLIKTSLGLMVLGALGGLIFISGTVSQAAYNTPITSGLSNALTSTHLFVGNGSNVATDVALSGDATLANTGALTIGANAITTTKINANAVTYAKVQTMAAGTFLGNPTGSTATPQAVTVTGCTLSGTTYSCTAPTNVFVRTYFNNTGNLANSCTGLTSSPLAKQGDLCEVTTTNTNYILTNNVPGTASNWIAFLVPAPPVSSVNGAVGNITLTANNGLTYNTATEVDLGGTLTGDTEVDQASHYLSFPDNGGFGIGTNSGDVPTQALQVVGNEELDGAFMPGGANGLAGQVLTSTAGSTNTWTNGQLAHVIFTPTTGATVNLANNKYNAIDPTGAILALTVNFPSSPANNDIVEIKFDQGVTTVTYSGGTIVGGTTSAVLGQYIKFTYDTATSTWY